jgi:hypothetical protein
VFSNDKKQRQCRRSDKKENNNKKNKIENDNEKKKANYKYNKRVQSCAVWT